MAGSIRSPEQSVGLEGLQPKLKAFGFVGDLSLNGRSSSAEEFVSFPHCSSQPPLTFFLFRAMPGRIMGPNRMILCIAAAVAGLLLSDRPLQGLQATTSSEPEHSQRQSDPLADLNLENRTLFDAFRDAAQTGRNADVVADGKKLLASIPSKSRLTDFVTQITAESAVETGDTSYSLNLIKPLSDAHPEDWHAAALLTRVYADWEFSAARPTDCSHPCSS